ncbi:MAG: hypothetical protein Q7V63_09525 [Gammaproteobacteria bacterium]|nr:hypothetical protein [Gammaproteobacteria bacterium]
MHDAPDRPTEPPGRIIMAGARRPRRSFSKELANRPAAMIISHSDKSQIALLQRQFEKLEFRVEVEQLRESLSPISPTFADTSVKTVKEVAAKACTMLDALSLEEKSVNAEPGQASPKT